MTRDLEGKTALVTGGARGMGRAIVDRLVAAGALVVIADPSTDAPEVAAAIEADGGKAFALQVRVGEPGSIDQMLSGLDAECARRGIESGLDILVHNVGISHWATIYTTSEEQFDETFDNNVRATFFLTKALIPKLRDHGRVIAISSAASRIAGQDFMAYSMSKAAVEMFTRILAKDLGHRGITVNSVGPGWTATESNAGVLSDPAAVKQIEDMTLLGRFGRPDDIADVVHILASPAGRWVTGQNIEASGGFQFM